MMSFSDFKTGPARHLFAALGAAWADIGRGTSGARSGVGGERQIELVEPVKARDREVDLFAGRALVEIVAMDGLKERVRAAGRYPSLCSSETRACSRRQASA
jgi:hypothetical protein